MKKKVVWLGSSKRDLLNMPRKVIEEFGHGLYLAQLGMRHQSAKTLKGGTIELIEDHDTDTYRAVYTVNIGDAVYVLHCFKKKSKKGGEVPKPDRELIEARLKMAREHAKGR